MLIAAATDFEALRRSEFAQLDQQDLAYLDYTGAALPPASLLAAHHELLKDTIFGNPHSEHEPSMRSAVVMDDARRAVLSFFGVDERTHDVCFVANTSAAAKLVGEAFPFGPDRGLMLTADNHNSINGIRAFARRAGASVDVLPLNADLTLHTPAAHLHEVATRGGLLAFPAQSNFSGVQHPLTLIDEAHTRGMRVLLDAAAYAPTNRLNLRLVHADFTTVSFYKMFGYPTGIGALIATHGAIAELRRPWFAGGTVDFVSVQLERHQLRRSAAGFEDGTPNYHGASAVPMGLNFLDRAGPDQIHDHVMHWSRTFIERAISLHHRNGRSLVRLYGPTHARERGATVAFNLLDATGTVLPYPVVEERARAAGLAMRGGCFCNPGAAESAFAFDANRVTTCLNQVGDDFTIARFANCMGSETTVGAMRVSFGIPTGARDVERAIELLDSFRQ